MSRNRGKRYSPTEREELLELYRQSGLSHGRFCKEMELSFTTLKRWLQVDRAKYSLVEVKSIEVPIKRSVRLSVHLPNGLVCELGGDLSPEEVLNWVRELKAC